MKARIINLIARARQIWDELDYAQRRLLEIRTGQDFGARGDFGPPRSRASTAR